MGLHARMSEAHRELCFILRNPPKGVKKTKLKDIKKLVRDEKGGRVTLAAISVAARTFKKPKSPVGRPLGSRKTSKAEDRKILQVFKKLRPPGHGVDSREVHDALPRKLAMKVTRKTVISRLGDKGYKARAKLQKNDYNETQRKKRVKFAKAHEGKSAAEWRRELHGVGDFKEFTYYPKQLMPRFKALRSTWTYMTDKERKKPAFQRPKRWFPKQDWKKTAKMKVFGLTTENGKGLYIPTPKPYDGTWWAKMIKSKVKPFLQKAYPGRSTFKILLDGEKVFRTPEAKAAMASAGISLLKDWPGYSPDLNPKENVWAWAEPAIRKKEVAKDSFEDFQQKVLKTCKEYPYGHKLVGGMAKRMKLLVSSNGANIGK